MKSKYKRILVTGGAGFIGSFLVDELVKKGHKVRIFDNLEEQVHGGKIPKYLNKKAEFIKGDVRDYDSFKTAIKNVDAVYHLAAAVGVAQSNYEIKKFVDVNVGGMANFLDILVNSKDKVKKVIINSSMTGLGEGNYACKKCGIVRPPLRGNAQMEKKKWEPICPNCSGKVQASRTEEEAQEYPNGIYAITKKTQQDMLIHFGKLYDIPSVALRCFNIYGPRQSLSNPYTGVTAIFISRIKNKQNAYIYEDGLQSRDFVSVHDTVRALMLALENDSVNYQVLNLGSGVPTSIKEIAETVQDLLGEKDLVQVSGEFRKGDIRHCYADISKIQRLLDWEPEISLDQGLKELLEWSLNEEAEDGFAAAEKELREKALI